ncbi:hypothetical protein JHK87_042663 [Glycine soja]|nr:hypothetical protein JHK87_042663 [Glycine soja]
MEEEHVTKAPLPDAFLQFLETNGLDPSIYTAIDSTPRYILLQRLRPGFESCIEEVEAEVKCKLEKLEWLLGFYFLPPHVQIAGSRAYREGKIYGIDVAFGAVVMALNTWGSCSRPVCCSCIEQVSLGWKEKWMCSRSGHLEDHGKRGKRQIKVALYLNCPQLNDLNLNSCRNLHPGSHFTPCSIAIISQKFDATLQIIQDKALMEDPIYEENSGKGMWKNQSEVLEIGDVKACKYVLISVTSYAPGFFLISKAPWYLLPLAWAWTRTAIIGKNRSLNRTLAPLLVSLRPLSLSMLVSLVCCCGCVASTTPWHSLWKFDLAAKYFERAMRLVSMLDINSITDIGERKLLMDLNLARSRTAWEVLDPNLAVHC